MILRRIVDWISDNQRLKLNKDIKKYPIEGPNEFIDTRDLDDIHSNISLGGKTSVLDFFFAEKDHTTKNPLLSIQDTADTCSNFDHKRTLIVSEDTFAQRKDEKINRIPFESLDISCENQVVDTIVSDSLACPTGKIVTDISSPAIEASENPSQISLLCKTKHHLPHTRCRRSIYTQTEARIEKQCTSSVKKSSNNYFSVNQEQDKKVKSFPLGIAPSFTSAFSPVMKEETAGNRVSVVYGKLFVFGCDRAVPEHLEGKMETKFTLRKRNKANGIIEAFSYERSGDERECISPAEHVISYPLSNNRFIVVSFKHDSLTDMFQIGRCEKPVVDFKVLDANPSDTARHGVSRYACRILVRRDGNYEARVYAGAFDSTQTIFIGESGIPACYQGKMDGFTTNGVLIMHPDKGNPGEWREVSICGNIYPLRSTQVNFSKRPRLLEESNVLLDGTLIDLCGVTLLWRTPEGLKKTPNEEYLSRLQSTLHRSVTECELLQQHSNGLVSRKKWVKKRAYAFLCCGHVVGLTLSKSPDNLQGWSCPVCRVKGPITEVKFGAEPGFYIDREFPSYAFRPCGHAASEKTIKYWASTEIPQHRIIQDSYCPFCGVKLNFIKKYIKLMLPTLK